jgi:predicted RNA-binding Zn ribbon-like protein
MDVSREPFFLAGNNLAIDFANSIAREMTVPMLAFWCEAVRLVSHEKATVLKDVWMNADVDEIARFRSDIRDLVVRLAEGHVPRDSDVVMINRYLTRGGGYNELRRNAEGAFIKATEIDLTEPIVVAIPVAEAIADLICFGDLSNLRKCANPNCILYFYDTTRNHRRRWCSMAVCGNRSKAAQFYRQKKQSSRETT